MADVSSFMVALAVSVGGGEDFSDAIPSLRLMNGRSEVTDEGEDATAVMADAV